MSTFFIFFSLAGNYEITENAKMSITDNHIKAVINAYHAEEKAYHLLDMPNPLKIFASVEITKAPLNISFNGTTTLPGSDKEFSLNF